jgi:hypothetical protein
VHRACRCASAYLGRILFLNLVQAYNKSAQGAWGMSFMGMQRVRICEHVCMHTIQRIPLKNVRIFWRSIGIAWAGIFVCACTQCECEGANSMHVGVRLYLDIFSPNVVAIYYERKRMYVCVRAYVPTVRKCTLCVRVPLTDRKETVPQNFFCVCACMCVCVYVCVTVLCVFMCKDRF